ncbi:S1 family peptidase [Streptomyces hawaiiensis]|uniref:S1 family peptidase n=1 Tax=Streptomyces hawaiiensis TaxID=67305 RepID=UPI0036558F91
MAIFGIETWVAVSAAVTALVSGAQVINREAVIPWRLKSANNAVVRLYSGTADGPLRKGSAVQIAPRRWVTASHVAPSDAVIKLKLGDTWSQARVIYRDEKLDLAIMEADDDWPWLARISTDLPDPGTPVKVVGWTPGRRDNENRDRGVRVAQDYTVQGPVEDSLIVLAGAVPPSGFSGAAVTEIESGKVVGILFQFSRESVTATARPGSTRHMRRRCPASHLSTPGEAALEVLRNQRNALERAPGTSAKMGEEEIRNLLLIGLNSHFEGQAAGEVFNNTGKTDILIRVLDTLRIKFGRIDSSEAPNMTNDRADQLALSAAWADGLSLRKPLVPGLLL